MWRTPSRTTNAGVTASSLASMLLDTIRSETEELGNDTDRSVNVARPLEVYVAALPTRD